MDSKGFCDGRVVIVTGAGRGLGRAHALAYAEAGARVVVNDLGVGREGQESRQGDSPAHEVAAEIEAMGGVAIVDGADVSWTDGVWNTTLQPPHVATPDDIPEGACFSISFSREIKIPGGAASR